MRIQFVSACVVIIAFFSCCHTEPIARAQQVTTRAQQDIARAKSIAMRERCDGVLNRQDLKGEISARRDLDAADLDLVLQLSRYLLDPDHHWVDREMVAESLGLLGHRYAYPALLAVLRDENEHAGVRQRCAIALGLICDKRSVDYLLSSGITADHMNVSGESYTSFVRLVGGPDLTPIVADIKPPEFLPGDDRESLRRKNREHYNACQKKTIPALQAWWKEHRETAKFRPRIPY